MRRREIRGGGRGIGARGGGGGQVCGACWGAVRRGDACMVAAPACAVCVVSVAAAGWAPPARVCGVQWGTRTGARVAPHAVILAKRARDGAAAHTREAGTHVDGGALTRIDTQARTHARAHTYQVSARTHVSDAHAPAPRHAPRDPADGPPQYPESGPVNRAQRGGAKWCARGVRAAALPVPQHQRTADSNANTHATTHTGKHDRTLVHTHTQTHASTDTCAFVQGHTHAQKILLSSCISMYYNY
jgi:hypothetical protein